MAVAAAQGQAGNASGRDNAGWHCEAERVGGMVDVALGASSADPRRPGNRVDAHAPHVRQVDDQAIVDAGEPWPIVAAATNRDAQAIVAAEIHRRDHVGDIDTAGDQQWPLVDHAIIERTGFIIVGLATFDDRAAHALTQFDLGFVAHDVLLFTGHLGRPTGPLPSCGSPARQLRASWTTDGAVTCRTRAVAASPDRWRRWWYHSLVRATMSRGGGVKPEPSACAKRTSFRGSSAISTMRRSIRRCGRLPSKASAAISAPPRPACIRRTRSAGPRMRYSGGAASPALRTISISICRSTAR